MNTLLLTLGLLLGGGGQANHHLVAEATGLTLDAAVQQPFTQAELEKMVAELDAVTPRGSSYSYPIKCVYDTTSEDAKEVNAFATYDDPPAKGKKPQAMMVVLKGLVDFCKGDRRVIRAVVAHEVNHLSLNHVGSRMMPAHDVRFLWDRQQEMAADLGGAISLEKAGYSKKDMIDMLAFLDQLEAEDSWMWRLYLNDHTSAKNRAAEVAGNTDVMKAMMEFEHGLALFETRNFGLSASFFEAAYEKEPNFNDALVNAAQAALMDYYEAVPDKTKASWLTPDFGPVLSYNPIPGAGRGDLEEKYARATKLIAKAKTKLPKSARVAELEALSTTIGIDVKADDLVKAGDTLTNLAAMVSPSEGLRYANNAALAYNRAGQNAKAVSGLLQAQKKTTAFSPYVAQSFGRLPLGDLPKPDKQLVSTTMLKWLNSTTVGNDQFEAVQSAYVKACQEIGVKPESPKPQDIYLCQVAALTIGGKEIGLFQKDFKYVDTFGQPTIRRVIDNLYPDVQFWAWPQNTLQVLTERGRVVRASTYAPGAFVLLKPENLQDKRTFKISVGMTKAQFDKILNSDGSVPRILEGANGRQSWSFFPDLMLGVLFKDDTVSGITVSPVWMTDLYR
jgi:tetratricopeptide (TPR) repeat protein